MPTQSEYLDVADATYTRHSASGLDRFDSKNGVALQRTDVGDGFYGAAFENDAGQIIIGFEGTDVSQAGSHPEFVGNQLADDADLAAGTNPGSFTDALRFTRRVVKSAKAEGIGRGNIFVDGHSLGGAEAEYVSAKTGLGGETFGAPGIPAADLVTGSGLQDYVEYGDPVGNYTSDSQLISGIAGKADVFHVGQQVEVGNPSDATNLGLANLAYGEGLAPVGAGLLAENLQYHALSTYAKDLA